MGFKVNLKGVNKKLSKAAQLNGRRALANQAHADMNPFVPKKDNSLRQASFAAYDGSYVRYQMPYAAAQFRGRRGGVKFSRYSEPGTGPGWDLKAESKYKASWKKAYLKGAGY